MTWDGERYQQRFDELAASGTDVHGEAAFIARLHPSSVLDAGCGTGRVARELARRGIETVGVDVDDSMIETARRRAPELHWVTADLTTLDLGRRFDVVVMAGNVPLFTPAGTEPDLVAACARHLGQNGSMVAGFELGGGYTVERYDDDCARVGLTGTARFSTWSEEPFGVDATYAVSVHRHRVRP